MERELTLRQKIFIKYWYFKLFFSRADNYTSQLRNLAGVYIMLTLYLEVKVKVYNRFLVNIIFILAFVIYMFIGYLDVKYHIIHEENSFNNQFNPELKHLVKQTKGEVKL
jgi:hypothetical protein